MKLLVVNFVYASAILERTPCLLARRLFKVASKLMTMTSSSNQKGQDEPSSLSTSSSNGGPTCFTLKRVEGSPGCFNDVIVFPCEQQEPAKFNFVFFGGDIQDYPEEMQKNPTSRRYSKWNLIDTGRLLATRINTSSSFSARANLLVVRADSFHLKCFAK